MASDPTSSGTYILQCAFCQSTNLVIESAESDKDANLIAAKKLADTLRAKKAYTNTATFDLKCEVSKILHITVCSPQNIGQVCGTGLKGEKEARAHAEQTGHVRFGEY